MYSIASKPEIAPKTLPVPSESRSKRSKRSSGSPELPEVFLDRSLGSDEIAKQLRQVGYPLRTMREVYSEKTAQKLKDERWLKKCGKEGWAIFSKDQGLRDDRTDEHRALVKLESQGVHSSVREDERGGSNCPLRGQPPSDRPKVPSERSLHCNRAAQACPIRA